ncbi:MAG: hypothetical protein R6V75_02880, partial [Bacteroidales bacterium]
MRVVNIDEPENRHFIQDFQLVTRSVVLAEYRDGEVVRYENLDQVAAAPPIPPLPASVRMIFLPLPAV